MPEDQSLTNPQISADELRATQSDTVTLRSGRVIPIATAIRLAENMGDDWANTFTKIDQRNRPMGRGAEAPTKLNLPEKIGVASGALGQPEVLGLEGGISAGLAALRSIPQAGTMLAKLLALGKGAINLGGTALNVEQAVDNPETAIPGLLGARLGGKAAQVGKLGPTLTGLLSGAGGTAGMLSGQAATGQMPNDPASLAVAALGVGAPTGAGALAQFTKKNAAIPEALLQIERATGKKLFSRGTVVAPTGEAPLNVPNANADGQTAIDALKAGPPPLKISPAASTVEGLAYKTQINALAKAHHDASIELRDAKTAQREADAAANVELRQAAQDRVRKAQQAVDAQNQTAAQQAEDFAFKSTVLEQQLSERDLKVVRDNLNALQAEQRFSTAANKTKLASARADLNDARLSAEVQLDPELLVSPNKAAKFKALQGAMDTYKDEQFRVTGERLASQQMQAQDTLAKTVTWSPAERAIAEAFVRTPAPQLGARILKGSIEAYDVAVRLAPQHIDAINESLLNTLVNSARVKDTEKLDVPALIKALKDNAPLVQRTLPQFNVGEVKQRLDEVRTILEAVKPKEVNGGKTLDALRSKGVWWILGGLGGGAYAGATGHSPLTIGGAAVAGVTATEGLIRAGDKLITKLLSNDDLRKSALSWAESSRAGRLTGDAGRAWLNYLGSFSKGDGTTQ